MEQNASPGITIPVPDVDLRATLSPPSSVRQNGAASSANAPARMQPKALWNMTVRGNARVSMASSRLREWSDAALDYVRRFGAPGAGTVCGRTDVMARPVRNT